jgi:hypothetical protein
MRSSGFSLLETAICICLLALLIGGILTGKSLLRAAEIRSITEENKRIVASVITFKDKYGALPGDMTNATNIWGTLHSDPAVCKTTASVDTRTCDGNGDKRLETPNSSAEFFRFWQHLANAGMYQGQYTGAAGPANWAHAIESVNIPPGRIDGAAYAVMWRYKANFLPLAGSDAGFFPGEYRNIVYFGGMKTPIAAAAGSFNWPHGGVMAPAEMSAFDKKYDDGKPGTGGIRTFNTIWLPDCADSNNVNTANYLTTTEALSCHVLFPDQF